VAQNVAGASGGLDNASLNQQIHDRVAQNVANGSGGLDNASLNQQIHDRVAQNIANGSGGLDNATLQAQIRATVAAAQPPPLVLATSQDESSPAPADSIPDDATVNTLAAGPASVNSLAALS
jgi:hypothetical protein